MLIRRKSIISGIVREKEIAISEEEYRRWMDGELIQNVVPHLSADDREFIMTGNTPEEWDFLFAKS